MLGRMFDGIEFRGFSQDTVETLAAFAGVPVWNGLTDQWHPTQMLADMLHHARPQRPKPLERVAFCYLGDARNNTANSLLVTGALLGMDVRIAAPEDLWPSPRYVAIAHGSGAGSGAAITHRRRRRRRPSRAPTSSTPTSGSRWASRPRSGTSGSSCSFPTRSTPSVMAATGNPDVKFMHCLPALHNPETEVGRAVSTSAASSALEVTDEVFESPASIVFDQAENRLHTIKAVMVATIGD